MLDTYMGMILPQVAWSIPFGTFLMRQFYMGIPKQLDEAAKIDGDILEDLTAKYEIKYDNIRNLYIYFCVE